MKTLIFVMLLCTASMIQCHGLGETRVTFENLKRNCTTPEELSRWMKTNLMYKEHANDLINKKFICLDTRVADCDDYAQLSGAWLHAHPYYNPVTIGIWESNGYEGHVVVVFRYKGSWYMFDNDALIKIGRMKSYQDIANSYSKSWGRIVVAKPGWKRYTIKRNDTLKSL